MMSRLVYTQTRVHCVLSRKIRQQTFGRNHAMASPGNTCVPDGLCLDVVVGCNSIMLVITTDLCEGIKSRP